MYLGIDCGTQSTKALIVDPARGAVIGRGQAAHTLDENAAGRREQHPQMWIDAFIRAYHQALADANLNPRAIRGIGVSGQQHGLVVLDADDQPLYPAKLWCDTETARENDELLHALGGDDAAFARLGILCQTGYTASKIVWLRKRHPDLYRRIAKILLPHDFLNDWLTGAFVTEAGDASGTGYFDVAQRAWAEDVFATIAPELDPAQVLPRVIASDAIAGVVQPAIAGMLGLGDNVIVASGGGDNMMAAIGAGNIASGQVTMSLGTSGTLYSWADAPRALPAEIAQFCASHGGWLPLVCVMNITSAVRQIRELLGIDIATFNALAADSAIGADGLTLLPFFNGERVPALPNAQAALFGMHAANLQREQLCRATLEGATFTLRYGLDRFREAQLPAERICLVGGGAQSLFWRQMIADVMQAEVHGLREPEAAALGAAMQAMWANGEGSLEALTATFVIADDCGVHIPDAARTAQYEAAYQRYRHHLRAQYHV